MGMRNRMAIKSGRFGVDWETNEIHAAITARQLEVGTTIDYYRFDRVDSQVDDIYDEGYGVGKIYQEPYPLSVLHVNRTEGPQEQRPEGFYLNDQIHVAAGYDQVRRMGLARLDIEHQDYLRDRFVYDNRVFRVTRMNITGQVQDRDIVVGIDGTEVRADEMINDQQFAKFLI